MEEAAAALARGDIVLTVVLDNLLFLAVVGATVGIPVLGGVVNPCACGEEMLVLALVVVLVVVVVVSCVMGV